MTLPRRLRRGRQPAMHVWKFETVDLEAAREHVLSLRDRGYVKCADPAGYIGIGEYAATVSKALFRVKWRDEGDPAADGEEDVVAVEVAPRLSLENLALCGLIPFCPACGGKVFDRKQGPQVCSVCSSVVNQPPAALARALR